MGWAQTCQEFLNELHDNLVQYIIASTLSQYKIGNQEEGWWSWQACHKESEVARSALWQYESPTF
jgi:hypothetical protein